MLEVCQPRIPCFKLGLAMGDRLFPPRFAKADRPGAYLRILTEGEVVAGDPITVLHRPDHGLTVRDVAVIWHRDHASAPRLLAVPELHVGWRDWAEGVAAGRSRPA